MMAAVVLLIGAAARRGEGEHSSAEAPVPVLLSDTDSNPLEQLLNDSLAGEPLPKIEDPLAPLAAVIDGGWELPIVRDLPEVSLEPAISNNRAPAPLPKEQESVDSSPTLPNSRREEPSLTHSLSNVPGLPAATCGLACSVAESRKLGTVLEWARSLEEAGQRAKEANKLVFVIHVSGNFESPGFT
jgi:hypothetical protein